MQPITGKPYKPTTQGKNERLHQTLFRWLDKQPLAETLAELQEQVDRFDVIYNTQRPHQGLPGRITPQQAWDATPVAEVPRPAPMAAPAHPPTSKATLTIQDASPAESGTRAKRANASYAAPEGYGEMTVRSNGAVRLRGVDFQISTSRTGQKIAVVWNTTGVIFADHNGAVILEHPWPPEGVTYLSNGVPQGRPKPLSPMS